MQRLVYDEDVVKMLNCVLIPYFPDTVDHQPHVYTAEQRAFEVVASKKMSKIFKKLSKDANGCQKMSKGVKKMSKLSKDVNRCQKMPNVVIRCHTLSKDVDRCQKMLKF